MDVTDGLALLPWEPFEPFSSADFELELAEEEYLLSRSERDGFVVSSHV